MANQTKSGKAFEFAVLSEGKSKIEAIRTVSIVEDSRFVKAKKYFQDISASSAPEQKHYRQASRLAIRHILELEPMLSRQSGELRAMLAPDASGEGGDVRDVLFYDDESGWELGLSIKNNHDAVKHSRLSHNIDFGAKWLNLGCSETYFQEISPIFSELEKLKRQGEKWTNLEDKDTRFYVPVLQSFRRELLRLSEKGKEQVPQALLEYLIGNKDFYKVIGKSGQVEISGFNLRGTLNKPDGARKPSLKVPTLNLPTRLIELEFKEKSTTTLLLTCDQGWQISFRIHNASSEVEPSLKFDIKLVGQPKKLYSHYITEP